MRQRWELRLSRQRPRVGVPSSPPFIPCSRPLKRLIARSPSQKLAAPAVLVGRMTGRWQAPAQQCSWFRHDQICLEILSAKGSGILEIPESSRWDRLMEVRCPPCHAKTETATVNGRINFRAFARQEREIFHQAYVGSLSRSRYRSFPAQNTSETKLTISCGIYGVDFAECFCGCTSYSGCGTLITHLSNQPTMWSRRSIRCHGSPERDSS
jgi:hypothetical protein